MSDIDHRYTDEITCPYCGYEMSDSWEMSDTDDEQECYNEKCGKLFSYERIVEVTYSSSKIDE